MTGKKELNNKKKGEGYKKTLFLPSQALVTPSILAMRVLPAPSVERKRKTVAAAAAAIIILSYNITVAVATSLFFFKYIYLSN